MNIYCLLVIMLHASAYDAYQSKRYDMALQDFLDEATNHPDRLELIMNVGSSQYQLKQYADAEKSFQYVANTAQQGNLRASALYNLGNAAYKQNKLPEAITHYEASLAINPNDADAQFNLEFVKKKLEEQQQDKPDNQQQEEQKPDNSEQEQQEQEQEQEQEQQQEQTQEDINQQQANSYLEALEESRPHTTDPNAKQRQKHHDKDW